ncbi:putative HSP20-like chaperone [Helianthus anomalus]
MTVNVPGLEKTESDEGQCVCLHMPEDVSAQVDGDFLLIEGKTDEEIYLAGVKLPENFDKNGGFNGEIKDGMLKLTLPMVKDKEFKTNFVDTTANIHRPTVYCGTYYDILRALAKP